MSRVLPPWAAFATLAALACPLVALSQEAPGAGETPAQPQTTSAQRIEIAARQSTTDLRRAATVAKQIYGRDELDKYGDTNALDVLKRLPGVNVDGGGPRMRGLGAGYTLILINGDPAPPGFALDQLSPTQIERIEVTRAPTADQSAQAVAGAINIILKDAPRRSQRDLRLGAGYAAQRSAGNLNITLGETLGPTFGNAAVSLPISLFEWRGENTIITERFMLGIDQKPAQAVQRDVQPVWGYGFNLGPRVNWKFSDVETLSLQGFAQQGHWNNRNDYDTKVISGKPVLDDNSAQHGMWQNLRANVQWINRFRDDQRIELKAGVGQSKGDYDVQTTRGGTPRVHTVGSSKDNTITQAGKYGLLMGEAHSLTAGWDLEARQRTELRSSTELGVALLPDFDGQPFTARIQRQAFYVQDEWEVSPQLSTYLGLRSERIQTESRSSGTPLVNAAPLVSATPLVNASTVLSPLWHITYKFDPKGRDMIRASLTRSYRAPTPNALLARPALNSQFTDTRVSNTELAPDRMGNAALKPELATGLDLAFEKYLAGGGLVSVGVFHRSISNLMRNVTTLQTVSWASAPRWISMPTNFSSARTSGLELEMKGRLGDLAPSLFGPSAALNVRGAVSFYRSQVAALSGPNNRLDGQQPWSASGGFDYRFTSLPLNVGANMSVVPSYLTQQLADQLIDRSNTRTLDAFAQWTFRPGLALRVAASAGSQPFGPPNAITQTRLSSGYTSSGYTSTTERYTGPQVNVSLDVKL